MPQTTPTRQDETERRRPVATPSMQASKALDTRSRIQPDAAQWSMIMSNVCLAALRDEVRTGQSRYATGL